MRGRSISDQPFIKKICPRLSSRFERVQGDGIAASPQFSHIYRHHLEDTFQEIAVIKD
jgi:hypothetical protein